MLGANETALCLHDVQQLETFRSLCIVFQHKSELSAIMRLAQKMLVKAAEVIKRHHEELRSVDWTHFNHVLQNKRPEAIVCILTTKPRIAAAKSIVALMPC